MPNPSTLQPFNPWPLGLSLLLALVLAGCHSTDNPSVSQPSAPAPEVAANPGAPTADSPPKAPGSPKPGEKTLTPKEMLEKGEKAQITMKQALQPDRSTDWGPTDLSPRELAAKVDDAIAHLSSTKVGAQAVLQTTEGRGSAMVYANIGDRAKYRIQFLTLGPIPSQDEAVADGKQKQEKVSDKWTSAIPVAAPFPEAKESSADLANGFVRNFTRTIWLPLTDGKPIFQPVVDEWLKGTGGYNVTIQERSTPYKGYTLKSYRIQAERPPDAASKLGPGTIQITIDAIHMLPVTIFAQQGEQEGKSWKATWTSMYRFKQNLTAQDFKAK